MKCFGFNPRIICALISFTLLTACGGKLANDAAQTGSSSNNARNFATDQVLLNSQTLCDGQACHPSIGMTLIKTGADVKSCTGFLIASDRVMTLGSCIPQDISQNGASCDGRIFTYFPQTASFASEKVNCSKIETINTPDANGKIQNFAILLLDQKSKRPPFFLGRGGFKDGSIHTFYQVNTQFNGKQYIGYFRKNQCTSLQGTMAVSEFTREDSKHIALSDCDVEEGGSGGPLLKDDEHVIGMAETTLDSKSEKDRLEKMGFQFINSNQSSVTRGFNFSCLAVLPADKLPSSCNSIPAEVTTPEAIPLTRDLEDHLNQRMRTLNVPIDYRYFWDVMPIAAQSPEAEVLSPGIHQSAFTHIFVSTPRCVSNIGALAKELAKKIKAKEDMKILINLPVFRVQIGLDSLYKASSRIEESIQYTSVDFQYPPTGLVGIGSSGTPVSLSKEGQVLIKFDLSRSCPL